MPKGIVMKALAPVLGLFFLSILVSNNSMAQKASYTSNGGLTLGFGAGMAYQKSDLANSMGLGFDFILGSQLYKKENAFLSVDWKFRFLAGENKAYDHRINPDDTYSNIRYRFYTYDLELGLTLNRLRERTRIVLTGFVGAGITHGLTFADLYDAGNNLYDFSSINPNQASKVVYQDLVALSDGDFETSLVNKGAILPTAGLFLGYQLSRSLTLGVEFKTNFYLSENNSFVGIDLDNKVSSGFGFDRNNYVSLGFRWSLGRASSSSGRGSYYSPGGTNNYQNTTTIDNRVVAVSLPQPSVTITDPSADLYHTLSPSHTVRATIKHVNGPGNISFYQNGFPNNSFTYNVNTTSFVANVRLREGENSLRIKATNEASTAEDLVIITLEQPRELALPAPRVEFTSPWRNQITSSADRMEVTASVKNINSKEDIQLTLDGRNIPFEFYPVSGKVETSISLAEGNNHLLIKGFNEAGSAQDQLTVDFYVSEEIPLPMVRFVNPVIPVEVNNPRFTMSAETLNVPGRNDLRVTVNGSPINHYAFSTNGAVSADLILLEGVNDIEITASNEAGYASDRTSITYHPPVYQEPVYHEPVHHDPVHQNPVVVRNSPPLVHIISPGVYPFRTLERSEELRATVLNVNSKENITLNINGINTRSFNFNNNTKVLTTRVNLQEGENVLSIYAQNEFGDDAKEQVFIKETRSCPPPQIRLIDPGKGQTETNKQPYALSAEVRNITNSNQLSLTVNGKAVPFTYTNQLVSSPISLVSGLNTLLLNARNECGEDNALTRINYKPPGLTVPCTPPTVSFTVHEVKRDAATHELQGTLTEVKTKTGISLTIDGRAYNGFRYDPSSGALNAMLDLTPGSHTVVVRVNNECGTDSKSFITSKQEPCTPPMVTISLREVNRADATHELQGSISGVKNKAAISLTLDGRASNGFQFVPTTGALSASYKLSPGTHTIVVSANNECGTDSKSATATVVAEEKPCGIRINPGNSAWQFCLVTPSGTFSRENLTNRNFSYSGRASSLYFLPIGGGGEATVNGRPYTVKSGQYYHFTGSLEVTVSTKNPGSMGQWSVCISSNRNPVSGNGNNRPTSPCEEKKKEKDKKETGKTVTGKTVTGKTVSGKKSTDRKVTQTSRKGNRNR